MRESLYFETSAVNSLYNFFSRDEKYSSVKTKALQISKKRCWYISSATLWEIFKTKDEDLRFALFDFSRCLFYDHLITSPEEIIINYIKSGCPLIEKQYCLNSSEYGLFAKEWRHACTDLNFAFQPDEVQLKQRTDSFQFLGKYLYKKQNGYELRSYKEITDYSYKFLGIRFESLIKKLFEELGNNNSDENKQLVAVVFHVTLIIFCYGITLNQQLVESFWDSTGINEPSSRIEWIVENHVSIFFRGPLANIARMMVTQSTQKYGRGLIFDSLHSMYTTYCNLYFTSDKHFLEFKDKNKDPNILKIKHIDEMTNNLILVQQ